MKSMTCRQLLCLELGTQLNKFRVATGVCGLKCVNGVQCIYACPVAAVMANSWPAVKDFYPDIGKPIRIKFDFEGLEIKSVSIAFRSAAPGPRKFDAYSYGLNDADGFIEWYYLINEGEFLSTIRHTKQKFVIYMHGSEDVGNKFYSLQMKVNSVLAMDSAGGHKTKEKSFVLKFRRLE
jgi:hypothetical protein